MQDNDDLKSDLFAAHKATMSLMKGFIVAWLAYCAVIIGVVVAIVYVAIHFITKFW